MQFLLRFHRFRRLLNSATGALSSRIDANALARPQRVFAFPQDVVSQASKASPRCQTTAPARRELAIRGCSIQRGRISSS